MSVAKEIKCVVWDLDDTLWKGVLLEDHQVELKEGIAEIIIALDKRGVLHSIASKNDFKMAYEKLKEFDLESYFLYPQINWNAKSDSINCIQANLNIGKDALLFIDDQEFERDEVNFVFPEVRCFDATRYQELLNLPELNPLFITEDSGRRRNMYLQDLYRKQEEENFKGQSEEFLKTLNLELSISLAKNDDLQRAAELTERTHQLNSTGLSFSYDELMQIRQSDHFNLYICELSDKYGSYGKIGLALVEKDHAYWHLKLLLMSCRVMSRGVGTVLLYFIMNAAKKEEKKMMADFQRTDKNKIMYVTYKFANFIEIRKEESGKILFENDLSIIPNYPTYLKLTHP